MSVDRRVIEGVSVDVVVDIYTLRLVCIAAEKDILAYRSQILVVVFETHKARNIADSPGSTIVVNRLREDTYRIAHRQTCVKRNVWIIKQLDL